MIRKFACVPTVLVLFLVTTILAGTASLHAQQAPAQQSPAQTPAQPENPQSSSSQEASVDEATPVRKTKPKDFKNWNYNIGGGASLTNGTTTRFVRGGGGIAAFGVARNANKYLGLRLDFQFDNLPLRSSALQAAQAPGATDHVYSLTLGPIINIPVTKDWGGYIIGGPAFYHRSGKLDSSTAVPGSACNAFFQWWGHCFNGSLPVNGNFLHSSQNEFGDNFGGGVTRKIRPNVDFYAEFRYLHGKHNGITTDLRPITIGVRW
jgi:opacity protein-like surface antigen